MILTQEQPFDVVELAHEAAVRERYAHEDPLPPDETTAELMALRTALFPLLQDVAVPLSDRIRHACVSADIDLTEGDTGIFTSFARMVALLRGMERLDPAWDACLDALESLPEDPRRELDGESSEAFARLLCYFLYRYMAAEDEGYGMPYTGQVRLLLAVLCTVIIHAVHRAVGEGSMDDLCEISRMFSSEIEYSEENMERLTQAVGEFLS